MIAVSAQHGVTPKVVLELDLPDAFEVAGGLEYAGWRGLSQEMDTLIETLQKEVASGN